MDFTSASANKYLRKLQDEKDRLLSNEREVSTYVLCEGEESDPPKYDYFETRKRIDEIDAQTLAIRHALHEFNMQTVLPQSKKSIDEALIYLAQLSAKKSRVSSLASHLPKERMRERLFGSNNGSIEYRYANYDVAEAESDYQVLIDEISTLQLELDLVNQTKTFTVTI